ncbi:hypothetical protein ACET3Z_019363 [Daucus carota]
MENHKRSRKEDEGMEEWAYEQTKGELSIAAERASRKMKFVAEMRLLQYREERKGRHWVPTKDETDTEVMYGVGRALREYHFKKDRDTNTSFLKGQITEEQRVALLEESWAEYDAKVIDIVKSNFDERMLQCPNGASGCGYLVWLDERLDTRSTVVINKLSEEISDLKWSQAVEIAEMETKHAERVKKLKKTMKGDGSRWDAEDV